jgi:hypothetical protein
MNLQKEYLRQRREFLILQAAAQRNEVAYLTTQLQHDLRLVNTVIAVGKSVHIVPLLAIAGTLLLVRIPRHQSLLWIGRLLTGWQLFSIVRKQWQQQHSSN